ncbi:MAG: hypothetical protein IK055_02970 [Lachnospiraceae bacterium]|nr:hypothetical protein [Lachnospiraceae bacterium]
MDKLAIINSVYEYSSTGALTRQLYEYGKAHGNELFVFFGRGEKSTDDHIIRIDGKLEFLMYKALTRITSGSIVQFCHQ